MKIYHVWRKGYCCSGNGGKWTRQRYCGEAKGIDFKNACDNLAINDPEFKKDYDSKNLTYWACKLFEADKNSWFE